MGDGPVDMMIESTDLVRTSIRTKKWYYGLLILTTIIIAAGIILEKYNEVMIAVPVLIVLLAIIIYDKEFIHVPPLLIFFVVVVMYLSMTSYMIRGDSHILMLLSDFVIGILLGSVGIIVAYMALGKMPGFAKEKPLLIAIESFSFGVAVAAIWAIIEFYLDLTFNSSIQAPDQADAIVRLTWMMFGSLFISIMFMADTRYGIVRSAVIKFLGENSERIGIEGDDSEETMELINGGESDEVEFKSTIRTNLQTGEKDKRMEKAVLKTIVAFLNSNGGDLFVGVADDGTIIGADIESFDNADKMNLHITNLLSSQIGDQFIPFIRYRQLNYGKKDDGNDRIVVRFTCQPTSTPVFLKDGKEEIFYVRSGPSSVELTGTDLIKYIDNRRNGKKRSFTAAKPQ